MATGIVAPEGAKPPGLYIAGRFLQAAGACSAATRSVPLVDIHRLFLVVALASGAVVLALNALSVVSGKSWLFATGVQ